MPRISSATSTSDDFNLYYLYGFLKRSQQKNNTIQKKKKKKKKKKNLIRIWKKTKQTLEKLAHLCGGIFYG